LGIDISHERDLMTSFDRIILIDTDAVDPKFASFVLLPEVAESNLEARRDIQLSVVAVDGDVPSWVTPDVGKGFVSSLGF
jgi:hypothetical protein